MPGWPGRTEARVAGTAWRVLIPILLASSKWLRSLARHWTHAPRARSTVYTWLVLACLGILAAGVFCLGYALGHSAHTGAHHSGQDSAGAAVSYPVAAAGSAAHEAIDTTSHTAAGASHEPVATTTRPAPARAVVATVRLLAQHTPLVDPSTPAPPIAPITARISVPARPAAPVMALTPITSQASFGARTVSAPMQRPTGCKTGWMDDLMPTSHHNDQNSRSRRDGAIKAGPIEIALGADLAAGKACDQNRDQNRDQNQNRGQPRAGDRDCPCQPYGPGYRGDRSGYSYPGSYYPGGFYPGDYRPRPDYRLDYRGGDYGYPNGYPSRYRDGYRDGYPSGYSDGYPGGVCRTVGPRVRPEPPDGDPVCTRSDPNRGW